MVHPDRLQRDGLRALFRVIHPRRVGDEAVAIGRCDPLTEFLAEHVMARCLDEREQGVNQGMFGRSAVIATKTITLRCMVTVLRLRYLLTERGDSPSFAEEVLVKAFRNVARTGDVRILCLITRANDLLRRVLKCDRKIYLPLSASATFGWALDLLLEQNSDWYPAIAA